VSSTGVRSTSPRRHLSDRRARTVDRLVEAAVVEVRELGYHGLTVRSVARRSGVAAATAYTYFSSKEHLVAEVFWRRITEQTPRPLDRRRSPASRATDVLLDFALVVADEAELAAATTVALLVDDPEVHELRVRIGRELRTRLQAALGDGAGDGVVRTLELLLSGALIQAGTGHLRYSDLPDRLAESAGLVLGGVPRSSTGPR
jgi:AcrR family transcriptional regulator